MGRMVVVGGEVQRRGLFGGNRTTPEWAGLAAAVVAAAVIVVAGGSHLVSLFIAAVLVLAGVILTTPNRFSGHRSLGALFLEAQHKAYRRRHGSLTFVPVKHRPTTRLVKAGRRNRDRADADGMIEVPARYQDNVPLMVGTVRHFEVQTPDGPMVVFRHQGKITQPYYTVTVEVLGSSSAIREEHRQETGHVARGQYLARLARRQSLVTHVQSLARSVPMDSADHLLWVKKRIPATGVPAILLESYGALCETVKSRSEQHRTYETFRIPASAALSRRANALGGGDEGIGQAIYQEVRSAMAQATMMGSIQAYRPLGARPMAALLRHLQDPDFDIDDYQDADLMDCWQHLDGATSALSLVVNGHWHLRTGYVPASAFSPQAIPVEALEAVISGIQPAVVHSVSMVLELQDARTARTTARTDVAMDRAKKKQVDESGVVTDGTDDVLLDASHQRLLDLKPGSGHHGAAYALYISFAVEHEDDILSTTDIIEAAAADAGIDFIDWMDHRNDLALITTMPFTRGIR